MSCRDFLIASDKTLPASFREQARQRGIAEIEAARPKFGTPGFGSLVLALTALDQKAIANSKPKGDR